jgi:membrane associated rhomboid family serine protease
MATDGAGRASAHPPRPALRPGALASTALVLIGFWFLTQLVNGFGSITSTTQTGVAYVAHIGGFIAGLVLVPPFGIGQWPAGEEGYLRVGH